MPFFIPDPRNTKLGVCPYCEMDRVFVEDYRNAYFPIVTCGNIDCARKSKLLIGGRRARNIAFLLDNLLSIIFFICALCLLYYLGSDFSTKIYSIIMVVVAYYAAYYRAVRKARDYDQMQSRIVEDFDHIRLEVL